MNTKSFCPVLALVLALFLEKGIAAPPLNQPFGLIIHGGAGSIVKLSHKSLQVRREKLREATDAGYAILEKGGSAVEAVKAVAMILESSGFLNAGLGGVTNINGRQQLDASICDGSRAAYGGVEGVSRLEHPIAAAYAIMTNQLERPGEPVLLFGSGAEEYASKFLGVPLVEPEELLQKKYQALERAGLARGRTNFVKPAAFEDFDFDKTQSFGTIGCCAVDKFGHTASACSTGGIRAKRDSRVGDSPLPAGEWANNLGGVVCTGEGEYFIRAVAAADVLARMTYGGEPVQRAVTDTLSRIVDIRGQRSDTGGIIAIDARARVASDFTDQMPRAWRVSGGNTVVALYREPTIAIIYTRKEAQKFKSGVDPLINYVRGVEENGGRVVRISPLLSKSKTEAILAMADGLLIPGGDDIDPSRYHEKIEYKNVECDDGFDKYEFDTLDFVAKENRPILGICRGLQLLNVWAGGTLYQDLPPEIGTNVIHRGVDAHGKSIDSYHDIDIEEKSFLWDLLQTNRIQVNSHHHQGVKDLASKFHPIAWSDDRLVEGFENSDRQIVAVQFHPERLRRESHSAVFNRIFSDFVDRVAQSAQTRVAQN